MKGVLPAVRRDNGRWAAAAVVALVAGIGGQASDGEPRHRSGPRASRVITHLDGWAVVHGGRARDVDEVASLLLLFIASGRAAEALRARSLPGLYVAYDAFRG